MSTVHLMKVPEALLAAVEGGKAYVNGALVKDAVSHQVLAHLQPTTALSRLFLGGPLAPLQLVGDAMQSYQLLRIEEVLKSLTVISTVGAAASVLNLGVALGGFAMVLAALEKTNAKLDAVSAGVDRLNRRHDAVLIADIHTMIERADDAFMLNTADRRARWEECDKELQLLTSRLVTQFDMLELPIEGEMGQRSTTAKESMRRWGAGEPMQMLVLLINVVRANVEALLCLGRPALAARTASKAARWLSMVPSDAKKIAIARARGRALSSEQAKSLAEQTSSFSRWVTSAKNSVQQQELICHRLASDEVDSLQYVLRVRETQEPELLMYAHC